jgi:hypothetical protein
LQRMFLLNQLVRTPHQGNTQVITNFDSYKLHFLKEKMKPLSSPSNWCWYFFPRKIFLLRNYNQFIQTWYTYFCPGK